MATSAPNALGALLRARRERLSPAAVGLPATGARRAKGLRREELSALAGISVDYIVRLEQGRATTPSAQVVASLARALQLDTAEMELLYRTAGLLPPPKDHLARYVPPSIQRIVARLSDFPTAVFSGDWTLLQASTAWDALFAPMTTERNLARLVFASATPAHGRGHGAHFEEALVTDLRRASSLHPSDPLLTALVTELRAQSTRFAELWSGGAAAAHRSERKTIATALVGDITLDCDVLTMPDSDVKLVLYTATPDSEDAQKLDLLRVTAIRAFETAQRI